MNSDMKVLRNLLLALFCSAVLAACAVEENTVKPSPTKLSRDDTGYFCGMIVEDHQGPKSQVILKGSGETLWFTTVRDGIAFKRLPEETRPISIFYVSAIDRGGWEHPENDAASWIEAQSAWFVIGSEKLGAMGASETIPFSDEKAAQSFSSEHGGQVLRMADIPDSYILGHGQMMTSDHSEHANQRTTPPG